MTSLFRTCVFSVSVSLSPSLIPLRPSSALFYSVNGIQYDWIFLSFISQSKPEFKVWLRSLDAQPSCFSFRASHQHQESLKCSWIACLYCIKYGSKRWEKQLLSNVIIEIRLDDNLGKPENSSLKYWGQRLCKGVLQGMVCLSACLRLVWCISPWD